MAAGNYIWYSNAIQQAISGGIDFTSDTFRLVITNGHTVNQEDTTYADISGDETSGTGYTAGGQEVTLSVSRSTTVTTIDASDETWSSSSFTGEYAHIVRDADANGSLASTDLLIGYVELEVGGTLTSSSGNFTVTTNASGALRITANTS